MGKSFRIMESQPFYHNDAATRARALWRFKTCNIVFQMNVSP